MVQQLFVEKNMWQQEDQMEEMAEKVGVFTL